MNKLELKEYQCMEELSKLVLVERERFNALRESMRSIEKLEDAKDFRLKRLEEAKILGGLLLDAEAKLGEMTKKIPTKPGKRTDLQPGDTDVGRSKKEIIEELGFNEKQVSRFEILADNLDIIEQVKAESEPIESDEIPTRAEVFRRVDEKKKAEKREALKVEYEKAAEKYKEASDVCEIHKGDFFEICKKFPDNYFDCIITDPPYPKEYLPLWGKLSETAYRVLKPGGFLITYTGHYHLPDVINGLSSHLEYYWQMIVVHKDPGKPVHKVRMNPCYKPILVYQKGPKTPQDEYICDVIQGSGRQKEYHVWQQSLGELEPLIEAFTKPNDLILDPFSGSGTTLKACLKMGRRVVGIDIKEDCVLKIKGRVADLLPMNNSSLKRKNWKPFWFNVAGFIFKK